MTAHRIHLPITWFDELGGARLDPGGSGALAIDEARALSSLDQLLLPEDAALESNPASVLGPRALPLRSASDDLRLPPPPVRAIDGECLFRSLARVVSAWTGRGASREGAPAPEFGRDPTRDPERRMISLLRGIVDLENEIRERAFRCRRA